MKTNAIAVGLALFMVGTACAAASQGAMVDAAKIKDIKAYCIDFNWEKPYGRPKLARLGVFADADPGAHLAWYKMLGVNVIQTFCVSTNGYAWHKNGFVPEQPGLKHDFLPEMVKLGHAEGMLVMGYFTIGSNPRWAKLRPDLNYTADKDGKISGGYHVVYTDEYLDFLSKSISDAVRKTGIDGFMIDWVWLIEWFDEHCGELITHLDKKGIRDDTLIVYLSANGWVSIRRRGDYAPRSKGSPYDAGVRSPIIYSWPARIKPTVSDSLVSSVDVVPTILAVAGAAPPKKAIPGMNLLPVMEGKAMEAELYDLLNDPFEQNNLYGKLPEVYESLRVKLEAWRPVNK